MRIDYAHDDHYQWVENATKQKLSPLGKAVANLLGYVGGGIYNAPIAHSRVDWTNPDRIAVVWNSNLTNWDRCDLSLLWVECMRRMLRVEVEAAAPGRLRLIFFQRSTGDREAPLHKRIPDCEEMIAMVDGHFGRVQNAAEQPEAGRDVQRLAMVAAEQIAEEAHPKLDQYKRGPEVRRYAEIIASHFKGTHPQAQEAVRAAGLYPLYNELIDLIGECAVTDEMSCGVCRAEEGDDHHDSCPIGIIEEWAHNNLARESPPTNAEAVRLLARTLPWIEFANEKAGEAGDKKNSADLYDDVSEFLAQHELRQLGEGNGHD